MSIIVCTMALHFVCKIIKWPLSTITLCMFCSKLAQGSASMYSIIRIEHQQGINDYYHPRHLINLCVILCNIWLVGYYGMV